MIEIPTEKQKKAWDKFQEAAFLYHQIAEKLQQPLDYQSLKKTIPELEDIRSEMLDLMPQQEPVKATVVFKIIGTVSLSIVAVISKMYYSKEFQQLIKG